MSDTYTTGTGQVLHRVHPVEDRCWSEGCVIHNPTDPHKDWPTHWRDDRRIMERICPHGVGHPDKDDLAFLASIGRTGEGVHGCDGCCA